MSKNDYCLRYETKNKEIDILIFLDTGSYVFYKNYEQYKGYLSKKDYEECKSLEALRKISKKLLAKIKRK